MAATRYQQALLLCLKFKEQAGNAIVVSGIFRWKASVLACRSALSQRP
jgi:hypothetical protein